MLLAILKNSFFIAELCCDGEIQGLYAYTKDISHFILKQQGEINGLPLRKFADCTAGFQVPLQIRKIYFATLFKDL
jgi:hypothetical protein